MRILDSGFELVGDFISNIQLEELNAELSFLDNRSRMGGIRNAEKKYSAVSKLVSSSTLLVAASKYLKGEPRLVRSILFNKTPINNWLVSWHQDKTVTVTDIFEKEGWGPWSVKDGAHHVQPPLEVLNQMITFRIHLDDSNIENGCLSVVPGSHSLGLIAQSEINSVVESLGAIACEAKERSALVMRPHLLHSSSKGSSPSRRRVLHFEYSSYCLPRGISWA